MKNITSDKFPYCHGQVHQQPNAGYSYPGILFVLGNQVDIIVMVVVVVVAMAMAPNLSGSWSGHQRRNNREARGRNESIGRNKGQVWK
jgi:hypothetical protein